MQKIVAPLLVIAIAAGLGACGVQTVEDDTQWQTQGRYAEEIEMGPVVEQARAYLEELALVVDANAGEPAQARERVQAFLEANREGLESNALALRDLHASLEGEELEVWESSFAAYMEGAMSAWYDAGAAIRDADSREWDRIERLLENFIR